MITRIQLLPTMYQLQREGLIGEIHVCALNSPPLREIQNDEMLRRAFPSSRFSPHPDPEMVTPGDMFPDSYKAVFASAPKGSIAVIAVPDQLHYPILKDAVNSNLMFASSNRWF